MAKPKHTMVPRRGAVLLALLASASNQTLLAALTVGSLNTAMVSSASAATCVTSVKSDLRQCRKRRQRGAGHHCGVGRNADIFQRCYGRANHAGVIPNRREPQHNIHQRCKRRQWADGHGSDGSGADIRHRSDRREYHYDFGIVFDRCNSQSGHGNRSNRV